MRVTRLRWTAYRLPFRAEFSTSRGVSTYREGLILRLDTDSGSVGLGEAAPLTERGRGTLGEALAILDEVGSGVVGKQLDEVQALMDETGRGHGDGAMAAVRCAFDIALLDAMARAAAISVAELLTGGVSRSVVVNATIGAEAPAQAAAQAATARESGYSCVKLKVGGASSVDDERRRVAAVRDALGPEIKLRIDANGAWGVEQAVSAIRELEEYDLEMVEQPVAAGDLPGLARVRAEVDTPIAADEDVTDVEAAERVLEAGAADVLVVKPMIVGGLRPARRIIEMVAAAGAEAVVTTTLDSGIGTAAALHLAATLPPGGPACGLATGSLLVADLITAPLVARCGLMELPDGLGLGVKLDEGQLARYGGIEREVA
ncbi:MAG: mandelate racemase/muconate lactonizing enzyme family protein [Chloroflexi bacterium]|nr:mandelate racemase/muconate lactonizing enzyme family protein [Chloroflexota bacterium]